MALINETTPGLNTTGELSLAAWWELGIGLGLPAERWPFAPIELTYPNGYDVDVARAEVTTAGLAKATEDGVYIDPRVGVGLNAALSPDWLVVVGVIGRGEYRLSRYFGASDGAAIFSEVEPVGPLTLQLFASDDDSSKAAQIADLVLDSLVGHHDGASDPQPFDSAIDFDEVRSTISELDGLIASWNSGDLGGHDVSEMLRNEFDDRVFVQVTMAGPNFVDPSIDLVGYWVGSDEAARLVDVIDDQLVWVPFDPGSIRQRLLDLTDSKG